MMNVFSKDIFDFEHIAVISAIKTSSDNKKNL